MIFFFYTGWDTSSVRQWNRFQVFWRQFWKRGDLGSTCWWVLTWITASQTCPKETFFVNKSLRVVFPIQLFYSLLNHHSIMHRWINELVKTVSTLLTLSHIRCSIWTRAHSQNLLNGFVDFKSLWALQSIYFYIF